MQARIEIASVFSHTLHYFVVMLQLVFDCIESFVSDLIVRVSLSNLTMVDIVSIMSPLPGNLNQCMQGRIGQCYFQ